MTDIINPKVQATGLVDLAGMLIVKRTVDGISMPLVGNNNLVSAASKLIVGGVAHGKGGRIGHVVTSGIVLDGVDDLVGVAMNWFGGKGGSGGSQAVNPGL